ncbi:hypothetical protein J7T55_008424 [Diaporthe amygdali]|uniref:uncharacterized protein n=1 Tax=Phomopsis amygdali TaxID=1214568 RepID=UPI0022FDE831|nr:uncharacterized protein J7T55_008424 [Diaporthe amygdali]KAJ0121261.1 hypothetical protein J7T55_008424 [Diaporthe amygdali]
MQFLKRPRPPKPVPRDREGAKRRGEKQLEEVSAFFLQKSLPEGFGASGRKKPVVSCPSSLDGATADSSASNLEAPLHHFNLSQKNEHQPSDQVRDMSRGTTHYTWSSSYAPLDPGTARMSEVEVQKSVQSSTPPRIRDTLEKTAMSCSDRRPKLMNGIMSRSKDVSDEKPQAVFADSVKVRPNAPRQEVRIVRYHDRGMMASEEAEATAERRTRPTETPRDAMQYPTQTPARFEASAGCAKSYEVSPEDEAFSRPYEAEDTQTAKGFHAADHGTRPKRPKSPKWTMVEQLEAAVENVESQKSQSGLPRASSSLAVQEGVHLAPSHYKTSVPGNYNVSQQGHLEFNPALFGDRQLDLFEAGQEHSHLVTVTDLPQGGQQAYKVSLAPKVALKPTCEESGQVHKAGWPSSDARTLSSAYRKPSKVSPMDRSALENHYTVQTIPSDSDNNPNMVPLLNNFGAGGYGQPVRNHVSSKEQFMSPGDTDLLQQRSSRRQSLEEYIAQMEYEVLSRPQQDDVESASPTSRWCELPEGSAAHLEDTPRAPHSYVGLHGQGLWQDGHFNDRSISGVYHGGRDVINDPESDQEEQRFMSTFWRPNRC